LTGAAAIRQELVDQLTGSVRWMASMQRALADGVTDFVEVGPGDVLVSLMRRIERSAARHSVGNADGVAAFVDYWNAQS
jgi:[acyl-carrier-protein] S-malonyltransferase